MQLAAAFLAGFAVLSLEVLGVHWLAPWFGAHALIWSNQIGVVLLAMAIGGWLGGRRAKSAASPLRSAGALLVLAGVWIAASLLLLPAFAAWLIPERLRLEEASVVFLGGSLSAALLFFAPPVLALAMVTPLLVEARAAAGGAGKAAGELAAAGTLGSLLGVFGCTFLAVPLLGVQRTVVLSAVALILAGWLLLRSQRALLWLAAALPPGFWSDPGREANLPRGGGEAAEVRAAVQSAYQRLRVIEFADGQRWLQMNEGLDSFQSIWRPAAAWPGGYYDLFVLAPIYALAGVPATAQPVQFWSLGFGSGAALGPVAAGLQDRDWRAVGVELDPEVTRLAQQYLPLPEALRARVQVYSGADARALLRCAPDDLDFILLDAYARQFEIPLHLATGEFFQEIAGHLRPGGVLAVNVGTSEPLDAAGGIVDPLLAGLAAAFGENLRAHAVPFSRNVMLFARKERPLPAVAEVEELLPGGVPVEVGAACLEGQYRDGLPGGAAAAPAFRDDLNPLAIRQALQWWRSGR